MPHLCCEECHVMTLPLAVFIICVKERNQKLFTFVARQSLNYKFGGLYFRTCLFEKFIIPFWSQLIFNLRKQGQIVSVTT